MVLDGTRNYVITFLPVGGDYPLDYDIICLGSTAGKVNLSR